MKTASINRLFKAQTGRGFDVIIVHFHAVAKPVLPDVYVHFVND